MEDKAKQEIRKNMATGASGVAGAAAGVVIGAAIAPEQAQAQEPEEQDVSMSSGPQRTSASGSRPAAGQASAAQQQQATETAPATDSGSAAPVVADTPAETNSGQNTATTVGGGDGDVPVDTPVDVDQPVSVEQPAGPAPSGCEVEVVSYERITSADGSPVDLAVVEIDGTEVGIVDMNVDGEADAIIYDANGNGVIEDNEYVSVEGQGIAMQPFQDAAGFNDQLAQTDLPDYVNDADVDTYMA